MKLIPLFLLCASLLTPLRTQAGEITLFNSEGKAVAYIDTDDELTIYLWKGKPVAYIEGGSIYGFNGRHLGWFKEGIVRDHRGDAVGFVEGAINKLTQLEPLKGLQQLSPLKSLQQMEPLEPMFSDRWCSMPLEVFLLMGR